ncbi:translation initiation factor IF-2-like [Harpia harpyja]|uniref:translation initiation factor IF-2-like n=1 Tax=Harpia harpyja TaxID=202280 RepID=UPI0022B0C3FB|nr:translation initiation factor IF-2-like [Harpia harpyja]
MGHLAQNLASDQYLPHKPFQFTFPRGRPLIPGTAPPAQRGVGRGERPGGRPGRPGGRGERPSPPALPPAPRGGAPGPSETPSPGRPLTCRAGRVGAGTDGGGREPSPAPPGSPTSPDRVLNGDDTLPGPMPTPRPPPRTDAGRLLLLLLLLRPGRPSPALRPGKRPRPGEPARPGGARRDPPREPRNGTERGGAGRGRGLAPPPRGPPRPRALRPRARPTRSHARPTRSHARPIRSAHSIPARAPRPAPTQPPRPRPSAGGTDTDTDTDTGALRSCRVPPPPARAEEAEAAAGPRSPLPGRVLRPPVPKESSNTVNQIARSAVAGVFFGPIQEIDRAGPEGRGGGGCRRVAAGVPRCRAGAEPHSPGRFPGGGARRSPAAADAWKRAFCFQDLRPKLRRPYL